MAKAATSSTNSSTNGKAGRKPSPFAERYQVRHNEEQMAAWTAAAEKDGRELQDWIRRTLDKAARPRS